MKTSHNSQKFRTDGNYYPMNANPLKEGVLTGNPPASATDEELMMARPVPD